MKYQIIKNNSDGRSYNSVVMAETYDKNIAEQILKKLRQDITNKSLLHNLSAKQYLYQINCVPVIDNSDNLDSDVKLIEKCNHDFEKESYKLHL